MTPSVEGHFSQINDIPPERLYINMPQELSGVTVVIIIALGVLLFILLFIFAKRQIMRFALRSRRGPHVPIGHDAKKVVEIKCFGGFGAICFVLLVFKAGD